MGMEFYKPRREAKMGARRYSAAGLYLSCLTTVFIDQFWVDCTHGFSLLLHRNPPGGRWLLTLPAPFPGLCLLYYLFLTASFSFFLDDWIMTGKAGGGCNAFNSREMGTIVAFPLLS